MGRILRKKPTSLKKRKKPEADNGAAGSSAVAAGAAGSAAVGALPAEAKSRPALVAKKPQAPSGAAATPPADNVFTRSVQFLREVKIELKKVTWPSRKQTMGSTLVVIVLVIIISVFLGIVDIGLSTVIRAVFK